VTAGFAVTQPCASATQVVTSFVPVQNEPAAPPTHSGGAALHWQLAAPAAPVHVSFVVQVVEFEALTKRHWLASLAHVETLPLSQNAPAAVHTVALHWQRPVPALHDWCVPQVVAPLLKTQLFPSFSQSTEAPFAQMLPTVVQIASATQPQAPTPGLPVQAWCVAHATGASAKTQLFASVLQVETLPLVAQKVAPEPPTQSTGAASHVQAPVGLLPVQLW
jgi:hypothetical protein